MAYKRISPISVSEGGTGISSATAYAVLCGGTTTTGAFQSIAGLGSSGYVLTSNGASALPTFQAASSSSGALVLIQTQTAASSSALNFTTGISSTYYNYLILGEQITSPSNNQLVVQISTNGGSTYITSGYIGSASVTTGLEMLTLTNNAAYAYSSSITVFNLTTGTNYIGSVSNSVTFTGTATSQTSYGGVYSTASTTANALRVINNGGQTFSGIFSLYGYVK